VSLANRAGDLYFTFRFLKLLTTPWTETEAYKLGLIDDNGKRLKSKKIQSSEEKDAYTSFMRVVFNMKRLIQKLPGGSSKIASYASALLLIREEMGVTDKGIEKLVKEMDLDPADFISERNEWYVLDDKRLSPGMYTVREEKLTKQFNEVNVKDKIRVSEESYPVGSIFGLDVYEVTHINTNQPVLITLGEIYK
jgi:hypothetical protein